MLYDLASNSRELISDTGAHPVTPDWIVAQGRGIPDGLGGGIDLFNRATRQWERVSDGDTGRITGDHVVWQELSGDRLEIRGRKLLGGPIAAVAAFATRPAPDASQLAWTDWPDPQPRVHVTTLDGEEIFETGPGIFRPSSAA